MTGRSTKLSITAITGFFALILGGATEPGCHPEGTEEETSGTCELVEDCEDLTWPIR